MTLPARMKFGIFLAPFHQLGENPTLALERDLELLEWLDYLGFDEAWIGEHHSAGWEIIASPEVFIGAAAERTKHIKLGTGVDLAALPQPADGREPHGAARPPHARPRHARRRPRRSRHRRADAGHRPGDAAPAHGRGDDGHHRACSPADEPMTHQSDWFKLTQRPPAAAALHAAPHARSRSPPCGRPPAWSWRASTASACSRSRAPRGEDDALNDFWNIAEKTAAEHGKTVDRNEWRLVLHVHLAETRGAGAGRGAGARRHVLARLLRGHDGLPQRLRGRQGRRSSTRWTSADIWCIGTPDDLVAAINRLDEQQRRLRRPDHPAGRLGDARAGDAQLRAHRALREAALPGQPRRPGSLAGRSRRVPPSRCAPCAKTRRGERGRRTRSTPPERRRRAGRSPALPSPAQ